VVPKPDAADSSKTPGVGALEKFFRNIEERTQDATHRRLIRAARKKHPTNALEAELGRIVQEILDEA
jgi:hypothetical protein